MRRTSLLSSLLPVFVTVEADRPGIPPLSPLSLKNRDDCLARGAVARLADSLGEFSTKQSESLASVASGNCSPGDMSVPVRNENSPAHKQQSRDLHTTQAYSTELALSRLLSAHTFCSLSSRSRARSLLLAQSAKFKHGCQ